MQTFTVTNALGQTLPTNSIQVLQGIIDELKLAPAEEYVDAGVTATTMVHVPEVEGEPWGKYAIEWNSDDVAAYQAARAAVITSIAQATQLAEPEVKRMLVNADAFPPTGVAMIEAPRLRRQLENLVKLYNARVLGKTSGSGLVIASGIFLGMALLGVMAYSRWRLERGR